MNRHVLYRWLAKYLPQRQGGHTETGHTHESVPIAQNEKGASGFPKAKYLEEKPSDWSLASLLWPFSHLIHSAHAFIFPKAKS